MRRPLPDPPGPGQESVWAYPRPPRLERTRSRIEVVLGGHVIAATGTALRVLETSHPPTYYLPRSCFVDGALRPAGDGTVCEWKGRASYADVVGGDLVAPRAAWHYPDPTPAFAAIRDHVALYPGAMERCTVDGQLVTPQPGGFYGGWVTSSVTGPFKGGPGSMWW
ncbi:MAG: DUF427 domain-containing protein [Nocardioidaceae bacterium]